MDPPTTDPPNATPLVESGLQRVLDEMQAGRAYEPVGLGDRLGMVASPVRTRLEELARAGVVEEVMFWNGGGRRRSRFLD